MALLFFFFFFNDTATTEIYTLSLHDALPISPRTWRIRSPGASAAYRGGPPRLRPPPRPEAQPGPRPRPGKHAGSGPDEDPRDHSPTSSNEWCRRWESNPHAAFAAPGFKPTPGLPPHVPHRTPSSRILGGSATSRDGFRDMRDVGDRTPT